MIIETILGDTANIITALSSIAAALIALKTYLDSKKNNNSIFYPDQEKINILLENLIKIPESRKTTEYIELLNEYTIVVNKFNSKIGFVQKNVMKDHLFPILKESGEKELEEKISVIPIDIFRNFEEIKKSQYTSKDIAKIADMTNEEHRWLITLSVYIENLYQNNRTEEAEKIKYGILMRGKHGDKNLKFCNLYLRGYLKNFLIDLHLKGERILDSKIDKFVDDAKDIFFINKRMNIYIMLSVVKKINKALQKNRNYIAIHSLGGAIEPAKFIVGSITESENNYEKPILIDNDKIGEFSKIWYKNDGVNMLDLIRDTVV